MALTLLADGQTHEVTILARKPELTVAIDGRPHRIADQGREGRHRRIEVAGRPHEVIQVRDGNRVYLRLGGRNWLVELIDPRDAARSEASGDSAILAPMPGQVVSLEKQVGDAVRRGETVLTIESMKLQTRLTAPRDGTIAEIRKQVGQTFDKDETVALLDALAAGED